MRTSRSNVWLNMLVTGTVLSGCLMAQSSTVTYSYNGVPAPIFSDAANIITIVGIFVPQPMTISKVTVRLQIQYPNSGDLQIYLYSPAGTRTILLENDCGVQNVDTTFDDAAASTWKSFCPVEAGRGPFQSDQPLSNFNSDYSAFGTWRLAVQNTESNSRTGYVTAFALNITGVSQITPVTSADEVVNAASLTGSGTVAPGEVISIFGTALGPATGVQAPAGTLPTTLGGTSVTIGGIAAPMLYASALQLNVQVPFSLVPGNNTTIQVKTSSGTGSSVNVSVASAVPGIYTYGLATGPADAVNQDGSTNSVLRPAAKGSYISVYASGLGAVNPALTAGAVPPVSPLSNVSGTITAYIGGAPAAVQFAGAAPGYPGLYQLNLQVPTEIPSGLLPMVLTINGVSSAGVTVPVGGQ